MLLTNIQDVAPGMKAGSLVIHPEAPDVILLKPGAELDARVLARLAELGVHQVWVEHDLTRDLDGAASPWLTMVKVEAYKQLKGDGRQALRTIPDRMNAYQGTVASLIKELAKQKEFAGLTDQLFRCASDLACHCVNVAHIATLVGLQLQAYTLRQRATRGGTRGGDEIELGLGALLHDIGKLALDGRPAGHHEIAPEAGVDLEAYRRHVDEGYLRLQRNGVRPIVRSIVLNHHQRYDGTGWPDLTAPTRGRRHGCPGGRRIHVFSRIVAAANVLENLLHGAGGSRRPPVAALCDFAGRRFDGWFDPNIRRSILRHIPPFAPGSRVDLCDGRAAVVIGHNPARPCRPTVRPLEAGAPRSGLRLDLDEHRDLRITRYAGEEVSEWLYELPPPEALRRSAA